MAMATRLTRRLARHLDVRTPGFEDLEPLLAEWDLAGLCANPSITPAFIDRILDVGTRRYGRPPADAARVLARRNLSAAQSEWVLARETRISVLSEFVRHHCLDEAAVSALRERAASFTPSARRELSESLVGQMVRFPDSGATAHPAIEGILDEVDLMTLWEASAAGCAAADARVVASLGSLVVVTSSAFENSHLDRLLECRPDLYPAIAEVAGPWLRSRMASTRHARGALQRTLLRLDEMGRSDWASANEETVERLAHNPVAEPAVLDEAAALSGSPRVTDAVRWRRAQWGETFCVREPFEAVREPEVLAVLARRVIDAEGPLRGSRLYEASALLANPHLDAGVRTTIAQRVDAVASEPSSTTRPYDPQWREHLVYAHQSRADLEATLATASVEEFVAALYNTYLVNRWPQASPAERWLIDTVGGDPVRWRRLVGLLDSWTLSMGELLETLEVLTSA